ncbi:MAG TPA: hypothetical protein VD948_12560 [Rhodothermales bacterium]|nr:hypothetical protein [Rhodothermales bacterium]
MAWFTYTALVDGMVLTAADINTPLSNAANGTVTVAHGGTGLTAGTSGGVPYFSGSTTIASSGALTASRIVLGGGAGAAPSSLTFGTANQVLGMNSGATAYEHKTITAGSNITVTHAANSITIASTASFAITRSTQDVATSETTTSTSYTDLATSGPAITLSPGGATDQILVYSAEMSSGTVNGQCHASPAIAGSGASDADMVLASSPAAGVPYRASAHAFPTSVANGSTHTLKYKVNVGTGTFVRRRMSGHTLS